MQEVTLALAILLCAGFAAAKIGQLLKLPSVTGYIVAGLLLGPSGFGLIPIDTTAANLEHFTQIALMLIAFGIGEHLEIRRLRHNSKKISYITLSESLGAFLFVSVGCYTFTIATGLINSDWTITDVLVLSILLGAIAIATAPASTLHVIRELKAAGPMTSTLLQVVALNNGIAIMTFGIVLSISQQMIGKGSGASLAPVAASIVDIFFSLLIGIVNGLIIDLIIHRLKRRSEMLTIGLSLLLLGGEIARLFALSPLLTGMMTGFTIVNRDRRDVRLFRIINTFEPPIYVLFFTLAGAHLDINMLSLAGWLGLLYFILRALGKIIGATVGSLAARAPASVCKYLGISLQSQAGVAIGLVFLIREAYPDFAMHAEILTPVVLAGVFIAELAGPVSLRYAASRCSETIDAIAPTPPPQTAAGFEEELELVPWNWSRLQPSQNPDGTIVIGSYSPKTAGGLSRIATLLAHYYEARPLAVHIVPKTCDDNECALPYSLFTIEENETKQMGYELSTAVIHSDNIAEALVATAKQSSARAIVLGYPVSERPQDFHRVVDTVARTAPCKVVLVRFAGILHTERILVPIVSLQDLPDILDILRALTIVGKHRITMLCLLSSEAEEEEILEYEKKLLDWSLDNSLGSYVYCKPAKAETRIESILEEAGNHDLLVMVSAKAHGLQRLFFGSLAGDVAYRCPKPLIIIHTPKNPSK